MHNTTNMVDKKPQGELSPLDIEKDGGLSAPLTELDTPKKKPTFKMVGTLVMAMRRFQSEFPGRV